ncbi:MAG: CvpA family protein, partial [Proteobacteria bacterium]|nr:CvpA family protein [Pseudomonadota bacterium]
MDLISIDKINFVDIIILSILALSLLFGMARGFFASVLSLIGWCFSLLIAYYIGPYAQKLLSGTIQSQVVLVPLSYFAILIISLIFFAIFNATTLLSIKNLRGGFIDFLLGAAFGFARGFVFIVLCLTMLHVVYSVANGKNSKEDDSMPPSVRESATYFMLKSSYMTATNFLPDHIIERLQEVVDVLSGENSNERFIVSVNKKLSSYLTDRELSIIEKIREE